ncbi:glycosyltransferase family 4 protein [Chloroflexota bacterium]
MNASKPRILHVIDHSDSGGCQSQLAIRLADLKDRYEFSVAVLGRKGDFTLQYQQLGFSVFELGGGRNRWNPGVFIPLIKLVRREKPDIIHAHLLKSMLLSPLVARLTGTASIITDDTGINQQTLAFYFPDTIVRLFLTWALHLVVILSDKIVVLTNSNKNDYLQEFNIPESKVEILPNSIDSDPPPGMVEKVDLRRELELSSEAKVILMVGRLASEKDWPTFLEVAEKFPDAERYAFIVVGSGYLKASLQETALKKGLTNLHFLGERKDVPVLLSQADAFLLTSRQEAFGIVILEAMAAGCPVIASRTPGANSIIEHGHNGLLVEMEDVDGFVSSLEEILADPLLADNLVHNARLSLAQFTPEKITTKLANLYTMVLKNRRQVKP